MKALSLTVQEDKIARFIALGFIEKEIADKLFISAKTVHTHSQMIRRKLNAKNIADVTRNYIFSLKNPFDLYDVVGLTEIKSA
jgi:two-component system response regulator NreC